MKYILGFITAVFQLIIGYFMLILGGFGLSILKNELGLVGPDNSNPWWNTPSQFIFFTLSSSVGVWIVGWLAAKLRKIDFDSRKSWWGTFAGSAFGVIIATIFYLIQGAVGLMPITLALIGAVVGFYVQPLIWK